MADPILPASVCLTCKGEGAVDGEFCYPCLGTGYRSSIAENIFFKQLLDKVNGLSFSSEIFKSYLIIEALDSTEYNALTDAQKLNLITVVSAGAVDLSSGSNGRALLMALFGAGTTTRANMLALLD